MCLIFELFLSVNTDGISFQWQMRVAEHLEAYFGETVTG